MQRATEPMVIATATAHFSPCVARATLKAQRAATNVRAISDRMEKRGKIKVEPSRFGARSTVVESTSSWLAAYRDDLSIRRMLKRLPVPKSVCPGHDVSIRVNWPHIGATAGAGVPRSPLGRHECGIFPIWDRTSPNLWPILPDRWPGSAGPPIAQ